jgi:hypothetical protein
MGWKSIGDAIWDTLGFRNLRLMNGNSSAAPQIRYDRGGEDGDDKLHNWILAWMLCGDRVRDGRRVYYRDDLGGNSGGDFYPGITAEEMRMAGGTAEGMRRLDEMMLGKGKGVVMMTKIKMGDLTLEERETAIIQNAGERGIWRIYSDDPVMISRLEKLGMKGVERGDGIGKEFLVTANQVSFRRERIVTQEERDRKADHARRAFGHSQPKSTAPQIREVPERAVCEYCDGTGWEDGLVDGDERVVCGMCGGTGTAADS